MSKYQITYKMNYEPADIKTLAKMLRHGSPFMPEITIEDLDDIDDIFTTEKTLVLDNVNTVLDKVNNNMWVRVGNAIYKLTLFHTNPVDNERYGYRMFDAKMISDHQYIIYSSCVGVDFKIGEVSSTLYNKFRDIIKIKKLKGEV